MEARKCQVCGEHHWGFECGKGPKSKAMKAVEEIAKTPFDRAAYQKNYMREYMRDYRKRTKDEK